MSPPSEKLEGLGAALALLRKQSGMTQVGLAKASGVARGMISDYEAGSRQPLPSTLHKLLLAMKGSFTDLDAALREVRGEPATKATNGNSAPPPDDARPASSLPRPTASGLRPEVRSLFAADAALIDEVVDRRVGRILGHMRRAHLEDEDDDEHAAG